MHYFVSWTLDKWRIDHVFLYDILSNIWRMFSQDWTFALPLIFLYAIVWILLETWCPKLIPGHEMGSHQYRVIWNYALNIISWCSPNIFIYLFQLYHKGKKKRKVNLAGLTEMVNILYLIIYRIEFHTVLWLQIFWTAAGEVAVVNKIIL